MTIELFIDLFVRVAGIIILLNLTIPDEFLGPKAHYWGSGFLMLALVLDILLILKVV